MASRSRLATERVGGAGELVVELRAATPSELEDLVADVAPWGAPALTAGHAASVKGGHATKRPAAHTVGVLRRGAPTEKSGGDLLSRGVTPQVPSARAVFTAVFGMGTGVTPPLLPPETLSSQSPLEN